MRGVVGKLGRSRRRWKDNITLDFKTVGWDGLDWVRVAQDRDNLRVLLTL